MTITMCSIQKYGSRPEGIKPSASRSGEFRSGPAAILVLGGNHTEKIALFLNEVKEGTGE
jgi:hypothetical protein